MGGFIAKQPNGLYCRFSTVVDTVTDWNMTEEDYINMRVEKAAEEARKEAKKALEKYLEPFDKVKDYFFFSNNNSITMFHICKTIIVLNQKPNWNKK